MLFSSSITLDISLMDRFFLSATPFCCGVYLQKNSCPIPSPDNWRTSQKTTHVHHRTWGTWSFRLSPIRQGFSPSRYRTRLRSSSRSGMPKCAECNKKWRWQKYRLPPILTFYVGPHTFEWIKSRSLGNGNQWRFPNWRALQTWAFRPLNFGEPKRMFFIYIS